MKYLEILRAQLTALTESVSASFAPTTKVYGIFSSSARRILAPNLSL